MTTLTHPIEHADRIASREWRMARDFDASRELVYKAWIVPPLLARWWGPREFAVPLCVTDARPGGAYRIVMRSPDGIDYPLRGRYRDLVEPERIVMTRSWEEHPREWWRRLHDLGGQGEDEAAATALDTVMFVERDGVTTVVLRSLFDSSAIRDALVAMGMDDGWSQSFDRLEELLARL